jgi:hypothetical protein
MVGERGFEPPTPWSRIQRPQQEGMRRSECKLHACNGVGHFWPSATWAGKHPLTPTCTGLDARVTSQVTSQTPSTSQPEPIPPASGPGNPENFFAPRFKLIARRVAVSIRVPYAQTKNMKFELSPFIARVYPFFPGRASRVLLKKSKTGT